MAEIKVVAADCIGCEQCVSACPFGQIGLVDGIAAIAEGCTLCGACVSACPAGAIELQRGTAAVTASADAHQGVWVFAEQANGQLKPVALELLGEASRLATTLQTTVSAVLIGAGVAAAGQQLIHFGADQVLLVEDDRLRLYNDELYADILAQLISERRPEIVLIGATSYGRSLAPRVASRLDTGLTADCTKLSIDQETGLLLQTRPAFGGNLMATIVCPHHRPQMATVRPRVMQALAPDTSRVGQVLTIQPRWPERVRTRVLASCAAAAESVDLAAAETIIAVGKGIGSSANLALVEQLAQELGAAIGATRAVVDAGWLSYSQQIGQTGKTVSPKLYIACGVSGAVQHLAGMSSAETIVAINRDPDAPIFGVADFGIVGDVSEVLSALLTELRDRHR